MFETAVVGNKEWAIGFFTVQDMQLLEEFDCEMRLRYLQQTDGQEKTKIYEKLVEENGDQMPTHCEHGIALNRRCKLCRALLG